MRLSGIFIFNFTKSSSFLQRCIIQQLLNEIHVSQKHPATAVSLQTQSVKSITVKTNRVRFSSTPLYHTKHREIKPTWKFHELTLLYTLLEEDLNTPPICSQQSSHKWSSEWGWSWWRMRPESKNKSAFITKLTVNLFLTRFQSFIIIR